VLRITVVRVYPTCSRIGSFTVRARAGVNRIRFTGRLRGRPLPAGGYRLIVRARGAPRDAAAVPIVVARGRPNSAAVRKARTASACSKPIGDFGARVATPASGGSTSDDGHSDGGVLGTITERVKGSVGSAAGALGRKARGVAERAKAATDDPLDDPFVLGIVGAIALVSALLGGMVLAEVVRTTGFRRS
jgi:hypothetical protein